MANTQTPCKPLLYPTLSPNTIERRANGEPCGACELEIETGWPHQLEGAHASIPFVFQALKLAQSDLTPPLLSGCELL